MVDSQKIWILGPSAQSLFDARWFTCMPRVDFNRYCDLIKMRPALPILRSWFRLRCCNSLRQSKCGLNEKSIISAIKFSGCKPTFIIYSGINSQMTQVTCLKTPGSPLRATHSYPSTSIFTKSILLKLWLMESSRSSSPVVSTSIASPSTLMPSNE